MKRTDPLRRPVALICVLLAVAMLWWPRQPAPADVRLPDALNPASGLSAELDGELADLRRRIALKDTVTYDWLAGRLRLAEAVARVRQIEQGHRQFGRLLERLYPWADAEERIARHLLTRSAARLGQHPGVYPVAPAQLEREVDEYLRRR